MPVEARKRSVLPGGPSSVTALFRQPVHGPQGPGAQPEAPAASELYLAHLKDINATFYDQLKVVDQKAAAVFTFLVAMLIWSEPVRRHFANAALPAPTSGWLLSLTLALSLCVSAVAAILVVLPRNRRGGASLYWGAWPDAEAALAAARTSDSPAPFAADYASNVRNLAAICRQKYRMVRASYLGLLVAVLCYVLALTAA